MNYSSFVVELDWNFIFLIIDFSRLVAMGSELFFSEHNIWFNEILL